MIIGLIGNQRSGKDTIADYLVYHKFKKLSFADPIKDISKSLFNWSDETCYGSSKDILDNKTGIVPREFFKWFGTTIMQHTFDTTFPDKTIKSRSIWASKILNDVDNYMQQDSNQNIVITDFRFMHEYELAVSKYPDIKFILVSRNDNTLIDDNNTKWEYEIEHLLKTLHINNINNLHIINNTSTLNHLYTKIYDYLETYNINGYKYINANQIKYMQFC
jgi:hypothetical protein